MLFGAYFSLANNWHIPIVRNFFKKQQSHWEFFERELFDGHQGEKDKRESYVQDVNVHIDEGKDTFGI